MNLKAPFAVAFLAVLAFTTACGGAKTIHSSAAASAGEGGGAGSAQQITLAVGNAMHFAPATLTVKAGQPVEVTLVNAGAIAHDFTLPDGAASPVKIDAGAGEIARGTFTVVRAGTYSFVCTVPGHAALGMRGRLIVQ